MRICNHPIVFEGSDMMLSDFDNDLQYKKGGGFGFFTYFTALESLKKLFIAAKCVKSQNHPPCNTIKFVDHV